ncbi:MAG: hypothetical protein GC145_00670 [Caulobacter sp.]|nr:hypothetical protein [Caulobacter sp.]
MFIRRVEAGEVKLPHVLIVESLDRLNRQAPLDALAPFIGLINSGITLVTLTDRQRFTRQSMAEDGGLRLLSSLIVMLRAHEESATKSKRVRAAWARKREEAGGRKLTRVCPAWLTLSEDRSTFTVLEGRAGVVRRIFEESAAGVGKASIARRLNAEGVQPFRGADGWHASYIQKLIGSDAVVGTYQPHTLEQGKRLPAGPPIENYFPSIIQRDLLLRARAAVISRRHAGSGRKGTEFRNILTFVAHCAACGSRMTYVGKGKGERHLGCAAARRRRRCAERTLFNFDEVERGFLSAIDRFDLQARKGPDTCALRNSLEQAITRCTRLSGRLQSLLAAFGADHTDEIVGAIAAVRDELTVARAEEQAIRDALTVADHGAGLKELREAVRELTASAHQTSSEDLFLVRARIAHAARCAGFSIRLHSSNVVAILG